MPAQPDPIPPGPDEIDRGLREIIAGHGSESAVREPSAAERASQLAREAKRPAKRGGAGWHNARKARKLRKPVPEPGQLSKRLRRAGRNAAGSGELGARRRSRRGRKARTIAIRVGVLVAFAGLLLVLHALGFGPH